MQIRYIASIFLIIATIANAENHIKYFGFALIDTYHDDPTDTENKTNYSNEISGFANIADILVVNPSDDIRQRVQYFDKLKLKTILHLNYLFFYRKNSDAPSKNNFDLRPDYIKRWTEFNIINKNVLSSSAAFYFAEEPTWNGIDAMELKIVSSLLKQYYPKVPTMLIEAHTVVDELVIPRTVDWVGFNQYFIDPSIDHYGYKRNLSTLKSKLTQKQRIVLVMDAHYIPSRHHVKLNSLDKIARWHYALANSDKQIIALIAYHWPSGFEDPSAIGVRGMPIKLQSTFREIGKSVIGQAE